MSLGGTTEDVSLGIIVVRLAWQAWQTSWELHVEHCLALVNSRLMAMSVPSSGVFVVRLSWALALYMPTSNLAVWTPTSVLRCRKRSHFRPFCEPTVLRKRSRFHPS